MDGKGWKPEYGITLEGKKILGFVEALPRNAREELLTTIEVFCRAQGYVSLHDSFALPPEATSAQMAQVIPILRSRKVG
jgi:hypothetical protein